VVAPAAVGAGLQCCARFEGGAGLSPCGSGEYGDRGRPPRRSSAEDDDASTGGGGEALRAEGGDETSESAWANPGDGPRLLVGCGVKRCGGRRALPSAAAAAAALRKARAVAAAGCALQAATLGLWL
jgi:hypothetical protein